jgi:serine/threonine-protein kinase
MSSSPADPTFQRAVRAIGARYRLLRQVGQGGMATVYLAEDVRHERQVAIKILTPELGAIIGGERFLKEIKVTATLQHPHILGLLDSGEGEGLVWYAMPFVDGETLRQRLQREHQLPIAEAVRVASEVADALHHAHRQGVIHRDIKPENVLLRDGRALVADFGIALAASSAGGSRLTGTGLSLGTPSYMSPEQAMGERDLDARSDQYSLAAMLYEMLTGTPPHSGPTVQAIISGILAKAPEPVQTLRPTVPDHVASALETALAKLPADRFASTEAFAAALRDPSFSAGARVAPSSERHVPVRRARLATVAAAIGGLVLGGGAVAVFGARNAASAAAPAGFQFQVLAPEGRRFDWTIAISPTGGGFVVRGATGDSSALYFQDFRSLALRPIPGTEGVQPGLPIFSPDGRTIVWIGRDGMYRARLDGSDKALITGQLTDGFQLAGAVWLADNRLLLMQNPSAARMNAVQLVDVQSGSVTPLKMRDTAFLSSAASLPDSDRVLAVRLAPTGTTIGVLSLSDGRFKPVRAGMSPSYLNSGHLLFATGDGGLYLQPFDAQRGDTTGAAVKVADNVYVWSGLAAAMSAAANGAVVYVPRSDLRTSLQVSDGARAWRTLLTGARLWGPRFSPDGRRITYAKYASATGGADLWSFDFSTATEQRLTSSGETGADFNDPVWDPAGRWLALSAYGSPATDKDLYLLTLDGRSSPRRLLARPGEQWPAAATPDGRTLLFTEFNITRSIWQVPLTGGTPELVVQSAFDATSPRVSPDGKWLAYEAEETGQREVYVQPYPGPGDRIRVSDQGGRMPVFTDNGTRLIYWRDTTLVSVGLALGSPNPIGERRVVTTVQFPAFSELPQFDVTRDGQTLAAVREPPPADRVVVLTNVRALLGALR